MFMIVKFAFGGMLYLFIGQGQMTFTKIFSMIAYAWLFFIASAVIFLGHPQETLTSLSHTQRNER
ncbi:MAG: hypothetical protein CMM74_15870 [Rhodospirillaceae bacterium]|nr:hypothetical protein [Rhodospirillaceae bacterium]